MRLFPVGASHPGLAPGRLGPLLRIAPLGLGLGEINGVPVGPPDLHRLGQGESASQLLHVQDRVDGQEHLLQVGDLSLQQLALTT